MLWEPLAIVLATFHPNLFLGRPAARETTVDLTMPIDPIWPPVIGLLLGRGPLAIIGLVIAIGINAIKGHSSWPLTHVIKKIFELCPAITNSDVAGSVVFSLWISASSQHPRPRPPRRRKTHAMSDVSRFCALAIETIARLSMAGKQMTCTDKTKFPTITLTLPDNKGLSPWCNND